MVSRRAVITFVIALAFASLANLQPTQATRYWNMPGTFCQWNGCGFGGGYHAPLVLGPLTHECWSGPNEVRLSSAPNPYACAPYAEGCGCGASEATRIAPAIQPVPVQPPTSPEATRRSPLFVAPVQY
jgi:hypothetical protein